MQTQQNTAAGCARQLITAMNLGSHKQIGALIDSSVSLASEPTSDQHESECRDLLAGIATFLRLRETGNAAQEAVMLRLLHHVAAAGREQAA